MKDGHLPVAEIFYSLRGEGFYTGSPATFIRLATCNLACPHCDTEFDRFSLITYEEVWRQVKQSRCGWVVFTGGEPMIHAKAIEAFIESIDDSIAVQIETNGTHAPIVCSHIAVSPKVGAPYARQGRKMTVEDLSLEAISQADEIKLIVGGGMMDPELLFKFMESTELELTRHIYLQPWMDHEYEVNLERAIALVKEYPDRWTLSLQMHKWIQVR